MGLSSAPGQISGYANPAWTPVIGASPAVIKNTRAYDQDVVITVGTVTAIAFSRDGITWVSTGLIAGIVRLSPNDSVQITYTVAPTVTMVQR